MRVFRGERGVTLIETIFAVLLVTVVLLALGNVVFQASASSKNQGTETTRAVIYAQDKMEKLLSLGSYQLTGVTAPNFNDCNLTPSSQPDTCNTTNITGTGWKKGLVAGGEVATFQLACPTADPWIGYVDYLDVNGIQLPQTGTPPVPTPAACSTISMINAAYVRQWQITDISTSSPQLKQVTVAVYSQAAVNLAVGTVPIKPIVILTSYIENPN